MFRVAAVNGIGMSIPSNVTSVRVVNPPGRPEITSVSESYFLFYSWNQLFE